MKVNKPPGVINNRFPLLPPPYIIPSYSDLYFNIPDMLRNCLYSYVYIWTINNGHFWMYPNSIKPCATLHGYQWKCNRWRYIKLNVSQVQSFF